MSALVHNMIFGRSDVVKHQKAQEALDQLKELAKEDTSTKTPAQLEHVLFGMQTHLSYLLNLLKPSSLSHLSPSDRKVISTNATKYMSAAESVKAVIKVKKERRSAERRRRSSNEDDIRRRLSGGGGGGGKVEGTGGTNAKDLLTGGGGMKGKAVKRFTNNNVNSTSGSKAGSRRPSWNSSEAAKNSIRDSNSQRVQGRFYKGGGGGGGTNSNNLGVGGGGKNCDYKGGLEEQIVNELLMEPPVTKFDDIIGLGDVKQALRETVILPILRPDIFTGLRSPARGILLFGPPGTGKTMIARATACESGFNFFAVSASGLTSKWVGEGEKMMRALFKVARDMRPSVVFMDEVDSLLSRRKESGEHEASRRMKTEFLVQLDGVNSPGVDSDSASGNVLCIACTNLPWELDDAVLRRFARRIYVPLPDGTGRRFLMHKLLSKNDNNVTARDLGKLVNATEGYSASDITNLCKEASMGPLRQLSMRSLQNVDKAKLPKIEVKHFEKALEAVAPSVSGDLLRKYENWEGKN